MPRDEGKPLPGSFYNQRLRAWHPILTPTWVIVAFAIVAVVFIPVGIGLKIVSDEVVETVCKYSDNKGTSACELRGCGSVSGNRSVVNTCNLTMIVEKAMKAPAYVYYELDNFYQNHRRYVKSRDDEQLRGVLRQASELESTCDPLIYGDIPSASGAKRILHPCGLIANSYFNDTIALGGAASSSGAAVSLSWSEQGISWATDRLNKFKAVSAADKTANVDKYQFISETYPALQSVEDEHFIVWMRTAALPRFRKLYARIETDIPAGTRITFNLGENFPVKQFGGSKSIVLSTISFLGGKNDFLGIAYIAVGAVCAAMAVAFLIKECTCPRRPGDVKYLRLPTR